MLDQNCRDVSTIVLPRWGRVRAEPGPVPWLVVDDHDQPVRPIHRFFIDFVAGPNRASSLRSYAFGLLRWWRWLLVLDVEWNMATSTEVRDFVLWMQQTTKPVAGRRTLSASTAGTINPRTGKQYLDDRYKPRTIRHSNAVLRSFYEFWLHEDSGLLVNPVPLHRSVRRRPNAHHNPLDPYRAEGRLCYNPKLPKRKPWEMPDERWNELFGALHSNRDRAILATTISNAARVAEILGVRGVDLDWGDQQLRVIRKGSRAEQWLPASPEVFLWIRLYINEIPDWNPQGPLWWTLRRRDHGDGLARQPMNYEALRAVLRRANALLGTNWSMHDLRHTAALRMARDEKLSLRDIQVILGHVHLATTADIYLVEQEAQVIRRVQEHLAELKDRVQREERPGLGYDSGDLAVLLGGGER